MITLEIIKQCTPEGQYAFVSVEGTGVVIFNPREADNLFINNVNLIHFKTLGSLTEDMVYYIDKYIDCSKISSFYVNSPELEKMVLTSLKSAETQQLNEIRKANSGLTFPNVKFN